MDELDEIFTPHEKRSYTTLLRKGPMTVFELSKETGIARTKLYEVCERLVRKGMLEVAVGKQKKIYIAREPRNILSLVEEKFREIEKMRSKISAILPTLEKMHAMKKVDGEMVTVIKGETAIINHFENLSGTVKKTAVFAKALAPTKYTGRWERWLKTMKEHGSSFRAVYEHSAHTEEAKKIASKFGFEVRFINEDIVGRVDWAVYDERIFHIAIWDSATLIQMNSPEVAKAFLSVFDTLWATSQK